MVEEIPEEDKIVVEYCREEGDDDEEDLQEPTQEEIGKAAYRIWEGNGRPEGTAHEDWVRAEAELWLILMDNKSKL